MTVQDQRVRETFIQLADTLVADFDVIDFLDALTNRCVELLEVTACGVLLIDQHETLTVVAASSEHARLLELLQLQNAEGPCLECYHRGVPVSATDLADEDQRWPLFAPAARRSGFRAVHALPLRLRDQVVGGMNLFTAEPGALDDSVLELAQGLADMATIGILHERVVRRHELVTEQLQTALNSRIYVEQAKGVLAERLGIPVDEAFSVVREHARTSQRQLIDVAIAVVEGELELPGPDADRPHG